MTTKLVRGVALVALLSCGGSSGGGPSGPPLKIPEVPPGDHEAACQTLCTLAAGEKICTATHAEFCVARCRASTRDLPAACAACVLADGTAKPIAGLTDTFDDSYCTVGGAARLSSCEKECDDGGGQPAPQLETLCQLYCSFYVQEPKAFACKPEDDKECLTECRTTIAVMGRTCAQCLIEQTGTGKFCINDDCQCLPNFEGNPAFGCATLCDGKPPS